MLTTNELRTERMTLVTQARVILTGAEGRDLTSEEDVQHKAIMVDVGKLRDRIEREERMQAVEAEMREVSTPAARPEVEGEDRSNLSMLASPEYRDAFIAWAASGEKAALRALSIAQATKGETLVPEEMLRSIVERKAQLNAVRRISTVISTDSIMPIPVSTGYGAAAWDVEGADYEESDDTFSEVTLGAHKATRIIKVSEELMQDERVNLIGHLGESFARAFNEIEETAFVVGSGSGQPTGVVTSASAGKTVASPTAITADELKDFKRSLKAQYRGQASFLMNDDTALLVDKLVIASEAGNYIWRPGLVQGQPDTLLGAPVVISEAMADPEAGLIPMLYGDFSFYWIGDRGSLALQRLNELYAASGQIGFRGNRRVDGILTQAEAMKKLTMAAS